MGTGTEATGALRRFETLLLLRWLLIVTTSYLVLFNHPLSHLPPAVGLFVAAYFASNLVLSAWSDRIQSYAWAEIVVVLFDVIMVSAGVALMPSASSEFFVVYFVVVFVSALSERLGLVVGAALLVSAAHFYTTLHLVGWGQLLQAGYTLRVPFLFVVALFFGHLVSDARQRERDAEVARTRQLRAEFLSTITHDLKNKLGVVESLATLLLDGQAGALNQEQVALTRRIHASTRHVITFALNLIDTARIEAGQLHLWPRPTDLADVVDDSLLLARSASELKGLELRCDMDPGLPQLHVDGVQLERVFSNLLGNAIKFTPAGGTVALSAQRVGDQVIIEVRDDGAGIPEAELPTIFDRQRYPRTRPMQGTGLGLSIVKAIVQAHGGAVSLTSALGEGTRVTVRLPVESPPPSGAPRPLPPAPKRLPVLSPLAGRPA